MYTHYCLHFSYVEILLVNFQKYCTFFQYLNVEVLTKKQLLALGSINTMCSK